MSDRQAGHYQPRSDNTSAVAGEWLPIARAALLLGIPERTLRRRVDAGEYETSRGRNGRLMLVPVGANGTALSHNGIPPESDNGQRGGVLSDSKSDIDEPKSDSTLAAISVLERAVEALERSLASERQRADEERERRSQAEQTSAMFQERVRNLEEDNRRLQAQLALPAPAPEPTSPLDPVEALRSEVEGLRARLEAPRAPWWRFWRRGS